MRTDSMHHIIRKYYLEVEMQGNETNGLALQKDLPDLCRYRLFPLLESVFDRYAPAGGHLTIEHLEIDAGDLALNRLEQDFPIAVTRAVENFLRELPQSSGNTIAAAIPDNIQYKTEQQRIQEAFIYFLKTGSLPWSFSLPAGKNFEQVILDFCQKENKTEIFFHTIKTQLLPLFASLAIRKRLVLQFSPAILDELLATLWPQGIEAIRPVLQVVRGTDAQEIDMKYFESQLWQVAFASFSQNIELTTSELVRDTWKLLSVPTVELASLATALEKHWPGVTNKPLEQSLIELGQNKPEKLTTQNKSVVHKTQAKTINISNKDESPGNKCVAKSLSGTTETQKPDTLEKSIGNTGIADRAGRSQSDQSKRKSDGETTKQAYLNTEISYVESIGKTGVTDRAGRSQADQSKSKIYEETEKQTYQNIIKSSNNLAQQIDTKEGLYVNSAGLVLLHPFLPRFFEALGIATDNQIPNPDRALCLLHFLSTGQTIAPEYELILPKILCNVPLDEPVESVIELTQAEIEESTALLEAVVRHWDVLRNTSIDGLRGTFLVRPGKVSLRDDGDWWLQVESQSFDILLDQLPWGISMIKLPWMQRMLRVDWIC